MLDMLSSISRYIEEKWLEKNYLNMLFKRIDSTNGKNIMKSNFFFGKILIWNSIYSYIHFAYKKKILLNCTFFMLATI